VALAEIEEENRAYMGQAGKKAGTEVSPIKSAMARRRSNPANFCVFIRAPA
jgi:hypothetical protein